MTLACLNYLSHSSLHLSNHTSFIHKFRTLAEDDGKLKTPVKKKPPPKPIPPRPIFENSTIVIAERFIEINESIDVNEIFQISSMSKKILENEKKEMFSLNLTLSERHLANSMILDIEHSFEFFEARLEKFGFYNTFRTLNSRPESLSRNKRALLNLGIIAPIFGIASSNSLETLESEVRKLEKITKNNFNHVQNALLYAKKEIAALNKYLELEGHKFNFLYRVVITAGKFANVLLKIQSLVFDATSSLDDIRNNIPSKLHFSNIDNIIFASINSTTDFPLFTAKNLSLITHLENGIVSQVNDNVISQYVRIPVISKDNLCQSSFENAKNSSHKIQCLEYSTNITRSECQKFCYPPNFHAKDFFLCQYRPCKVLNSQASCLSIDPSHFMIKSDIHQTCVVSKKNSKDTLFEVIKNSTLLTLPIDHSLECDNIRIETLVQKPLIKEKKHFVLHIEFENLDTLLKDPEYKDIHKKITLLNNLLLNETNQVTISLFDKLAKVEPNVWYTVSGISSVIFLLLVIFLCCCCKSQIGYCCVFGTRNCCSLKQKNNDVNIKISSESDNKTESSRFEEIELATLEERPTSTSPPPPENPIREEASSKKMIKFSQKK